MEKQIFPKREKITKNGVVFSKKREWILLVSTEKCFFPENIEKIDFPENHELL